MPGEWGNTFNFLKKLLDINPTKNNTWHDAAQKSGLGLHTKPSVSLKSVTLCHHLNVSDKTRKNLESFLVKNCLSRSENLVDDFLQIAHMDTQELHFPEEISQILNSRRKRGSCTEKQITIVYIRHELNTLKAIKDLTKFRELGIKKVKIKSCKDQKTCSVCKKHDNKSYDLNSIPVLPLCWECRCYYEPQV